MNDHLDIIRLNVFGETACFEHIGIVVGSIKDTHLEGLEITQDDTQRVRVAFADFHGIQIELIEPDGEESPVLKSLENGQKLLHLCFNVPDIDEAVNNARKFGFHRLTKKTPAPAFQGREIVWLYSQTYGLVELVKASK